jgi:uncharacterized membrane protein YsdA (DUF1294 family)
MGFFIVKNKINTLLACLACSITSGTLAQNANWETTHSVDEFTDENTSTLIGYSEDKDSVMMFYCSPERYPILSVIYPGSRSHEDYIHAMYRVDKNKAIKSRLRHLSDTGAVIYLGGGFDYMAEQLLTGKTIKFRFDINEGKRSVFSLTGFNEQYENFISKCLT